VPQAELPLTANAEPGDQLAPQVEGVAAEGGDDQPRRRRRRGGRNRNRRDRDQVTGEAGGNEVADSVDERDESLEAGSHDHGHANEAHEARETRETHDTHDTHVSHASPQPPAAPAPVVAAVATVTETAHQPVSAVSTPAFEAPAFEAPAIEAPAIEAPVAQVAVDHASTAEPVAHTDNDAHVDHVAQENHVAHVAEVVNVAPPAAAVLPPSAPSTPAPVAAASIDMDAMLRAAGLQMTETNPERLRVVQAEQSATTPAPRAPRERKPMPTVANEPLQQVETRN
jgi:ribonuclease E